MMHDPWTAKLSDYLDGELTGAERVALERHLAACPACTATLAELERVVARAQELPDTPPAADLWAGIGERIAQRPAVSPAVRPIRPRRTFSLPQLAAAAVTAAVASGGVAWWIAARGPAPAGTLATAPAAALPLAAGGVRPVALAAEPKYDAAVADLERVLAQGRGTLDPRTIQVLERNLALIDGAIADARRALAADPNNAYLSAHLARTMRWKIDLLRQAAGLAAPQS